MSVEIRFSQETYYLVLGSEEENTDTDDRPDNAISIALGYGDDYVWSETVHVKQLGALAPTLSFTIYKGGDIYYESGEAPTVGSVGWEGAGGNDAWIFTINGTSQGASFTSMVVDWNGNGFCQGRNSWEDN